MRADGVEYRMGNLLLISLVFMTCVLFPATPALAADSPGDASYAPAVLKR